MSSTKSNSMTEAPPEVRRRFRAFELLMNLLEATPDFQADIERLSNYPPSGSQEDKDFIKKAFKPMLLIRLLADLRTDLQMPLASALWTESQRHDIDLYLAQLEKNAHKWGLRCSWGPFALHGSAHWEDHWEDFPYVVYRQPPEKAFFIVLRATVLPTTLWGDVKKDVMAGAKKQFEDAIKVFREETGYAQRDRRWSTAKRDVEIFYRRVCLRQQPLEIWDALREKYHDLSHERTRSIPSEVAKLLGIKLR